MILNKWLEVCAKKNSFGNKNQGFRKKKSEEESNRS